MATEGRTRVRADPHITETDRAEKLASVQGGQATLSAQPPPSPPSRPRESSETPLKSTNHRRQMLPGVGK